MPYKRIKPLPAALIARLQRAVAQERTKDASQNRVFRILGKMKNIDHRRKDSEAINALQTNVHVMGRRVRQMEIRRNYPQVKLAIKRSHNGSATETIETLKTRVEFLKKRFEKQPFSFVLPPYEPIGPMLIAMPKINAPCITEILVQSTRRGKLMRRTLQATGFPIDLLEKMSLELNEIGIWSQNLLVLGTENGKIVLAPLADIS